MIIDVIVLIVLVVSAGIAFLRGFIREVLTIAGVLGGLAAAYWGGPHLIPHMRGWIGVDPAADPPDRLLDLIPYTILSDALSYLIIFILVVILLSVVSHLLAETAKNIGLGAVDRTLGTIFGLVRGIVLLGILYLPAYALVENEKRQTWFAGSKTHFYIEKTAGLLSGFLPADTIKTAEEKAEQTAQDALKNINILPGVPRNGAQDKPTNGNGDASGYDDTFRENMDTLIQENQRRPAGNASYNE